MNTQVGKSIGIALLLAAGLLAALFALGVFSPSGAGADVKANPKPVLSIEPSIPDSRDVTLRLEFQIDGGDLTSDGRNITVTLPEGLDGNSTFDEAMHISITQDGDEVGSVDSTTLTVTAEDTPVNTAAKTVVITTPDDTVDEDDRNGFLAANTQTILEITNLRISATSTSGMLTVLQMGQAANTILGTQIPVTFSPSVLTAGVSLARLHGRRQRRHYDHRLHD